MRTLTVQGIGIKPLEIIEYIHLIRKEDDSNYLTVLGEEAKSIYKTDKQIAWINKEITERKIELNNF